MSDILIIGKNMPPAMFIEALFGKPGPTAAEKLCLSRLNRTVEERRRAFAERMERKGVIVDEDELLRLFPEPLAEVRHVGFGAIAA